MRSVDTNILLYALNTDCSEFTRARQVVDELASAQDVVICELVLVELYMLLRNPAVLAQPLDAREATKVCTSLRRHPHWRLVDAAPVMNEVWKRTASMAFARRRIIDARLALTLLHHGVSEWITRNVNDFAEYPFTRVWSPFA
jgi:toxin-antitoxin system PIN domain toxin